MRATLPPSTDTIESIDLLRTRSPAERHANRLIHPQLHPTAEDVLRGLNQSSRKPSRLESTPTAPIFVVGCQRSGTTALAVMLDRHSRIAMMPETQFFHSFITQDRASGKPMTHEAMVERVLVYPSIEEANLRYDEVLAVFRRYEPTYPMLLRSLMEAYQVRHGKVRAAEKSCNHLFHAEKLLKLYPGAKIICILRDGRDVCRSLRNVPWAKHLSWQALGRKWNWFTRESLRMQRVLSPTDFTIVRYEDLMRNPEAELRRICTFLGEAFEPSQLEEGTGTDVIPTYEQDWKGKAKTRPDANRAEAWRRNETPEQVALWNFYMGPMLRACGYQDTKVVGVSWRRRLVWAAKYVPYLPGMFQLAIWANRLIRGRGKHLENAIAEAKQRHPSPSGDRRPLADMRQTA